MQHANRHLVIIHDGSEFFAPSAIGALGSHFLLSKDIAIISTCPCCEREIMVAVRGGDVDFSMPEEIVLLVCEEEDITETQTAASYFFCSKQHLRIWQSTHENAAVGTVHSLHEALKKRQGTFCSEAIL